MRNNENLLEGLAYSYISRTSCLSHNSSRDYILCTFYGSLRGSCASALFSKHWSKLAWIEEQCLYSRALEQCSVNTLAKLLQIGESANRIPDPDSDGRSLHIAISSGRTSLAVIKLLIRYNAYVNAVDKKNETPLALAMRLGKSWRIIEYLKRKGAVEQPARLQCKP